MGKTKIYMIPIELLKKFELAGENIIVYYFEGDLKDLKQYEVKEIMSFRDMNKKNNG